MSETASWNQQPRAKWPSTQRKGLAFSGIDLKGPILEGGLFGRAKLESCSFSSCNLGGPVFTKADISNCSFVDSDFGSFVSSWSAVAMSSCRFQRTAISHLTVDSGDFTNCDLSESKLISVQLKKVTFTKVEFQGVLTGVNFIECTFNSCSFSGAQMDDCGFVKTNITGAKWPERPNGFLVKGTDFAQAVVSIAETMPTKDRVYLQNFAMAFGKTDSPINIGDTLLLEIAPSTRSALVDQLLPRHL